MLEMKINSSTGEFGYLTKSLILVQLLYNQDLYIYSVTVFVKKTKKQYMTLFHLGFFMGIFTCEHTYS